VEVWREATSDDSAEEDPLVMVGEREEINGNEDGPVIVEGGREGLETEVCGGGGVMGVGYMVGLVL